MNRRTNRTRFALILAAPALLTATSSALACVVGTGTAASCSESALNACLPEGGSFNGSVTFNCGGPATITVTNTKSIDADTTIDGGRVVTISGGGTVGVFSVNPEVTFTVQNLTIANGFAASTGIGGAILNGGTLTVSSSTFSGNSAPIVGGGSAGGAIFSDDNLTVANSTFSSNSASDGGAIYSNGSLTVTNSTFLGNSATDGGGMLIFGTATITNSTFSGNSTSNFGIGGAVAAADGTLTVTNSILANSTSGGNCGDHLGSVVADGGHNIDDGTTCGFAGSGCANSGGTSFCNTNPHIDPAGLANNGGSTQTIALEPGSPAIDSGDDAVCAAPPVNDLDQRGFIRPGAGHSHCSIGAFEFYSLPTPTRTPTNTAGPTTTPALCCGDAAGDGGVSTAEATKAILALVNRDFASDPAAQCSMSGIITTADATKVILNLVNRTCNL